MADITDKNFAISAGWALTVVANVNMGTARTAGIIIGVSVDTTNRRVLTVTRTWNTKSTLANLV